MYTYTNRMDILDKHNTETDGKAKYDIEASNRQ